eukprot:TRINITY_DN24084_c0_g1_i2.p2 TRINITY_DN24084_c0_g1~~TRINITY_DN24084_c0_g1_i2.p2  ORF type:complete len:214 (-),score=22.62 TRINITY_DN24084_c0_g1_i2:340-981(-)
MGGQLAFPCDKYGREWKGCGQRGVLPKFPFLLPCLVGTVTQALSVVFTALFLKETRYVLQTYQRSNIQNNEQASEMDDQIKPNNGSEDKFLTDVLNQSSEQLMDYSTDNQPQLPTSSNSDITQNIEIKQNYRRGKKSQKIERENNDISCPLLDEFRGNEADRGNNNSSGHNQMILVFESTPEHDDDFYDDRDDVTFIVQSRTESRRRNLVREN